MPAVAGTVFTPEWTAAFAETVRTRVEQGRIPGGVIHVFHAGESWQTAVGWRSVEPVVEPMTEDTLFDLASLTKVVATTPSVMLLVERGRVELDAPVQKYIAEFTGDGREKITVRHLMTHTSGMRPGISWNAREPWSGYEEGIARACREPLAYAPGADFVYSDINFILLGEIVHRVSGVGLDAFAARELFAPAGMRHTTFTPTSPWIGWDAARIAPTNSSSGQLIRGTVHDPTSRRMGGVTGHAGLFSTADDIARYARLILDRGVIDGRRILREDTVDCMTRIHSPDAVAAKRGLGWDIDSRFSQLRGDFFTPGASFGHTGWTGTSLWIDPPSRTFVVLLTNRNHPTESGNLGNVRPQLSSQVAECVTRGAPVALPGLQLPWVPGAADLFPVVAGTDAVASVSTGLDVLVRDGFAPLRGRRVGLITNHTGRDARGRAAIDLLAKAPGVTLVCLFSPEHGIRGELDQSKISDGRDEATGLPVYSLYGERRAPTAEQLAGLDTLVFDIQDIGCRFYTYVSTMSLCLQEAAKAKLRFVVLDRPNPVGGRAVEGPLREGPDSFTAAHTLPLRHGMTAGELARMISAEKELRADLHVIRCEGWRREALYDETTLPWINPSPNMRTMAAALLYPGIGVLEFTNISVGRGTDAPFELVGAPWIDAADLARELEGAHLPGLRVVPVSFTPTSSVHAGKECHGVRFTITDRTALRPTAVGMALASALARRHPAEWQTKNLDKLLCHAPTARAIKEGRSWQEITRPWAADERRFLLRRRPFLLY